MPIEPEVSIKSLLREFKSAIVSDSQPPVMVILIFVFFFLILLQVKLPIWMIAIYPVTGFLLILYLNKYNNNILYIIKRLTIAQIKNELFEIRKYLIAGGSICLALIITILLIPNHFKDGIGYLRDQKWDLAVEALSKVDQSSEDFNTSTLGWNLAMAHKLYQEKKYHDATFYAGPLSSDPPFKDDIIALKDSIQLHIDVDSIQSLIPELELILQNENDIDLISHTLGFVGSKPNYRRYIISHLRNHEILLRYSDTLRMLNNSKIKALKSYDNRLKEISEEMDTQKQLLKDITDEGVEWRYFAIGSLYNYAGDVQDGSFRAGYMANILPSYKQVMVIAPENQIPKDVMNRFRVPLLVKKTQGTSSLYETVTKDRDPNIPRRQIQKLQTEKKTRLDLINITNVKIDNIIHNIVSDAIDDLRNTTWN